ncbi:HIT family protein [Bdellovibrio bacteriovorus]|uniref:Hit family hydrolase n=1 Tax=Bdellovibrio bacteriovorus str. Tiberius TaxID=1069642 RepID=K7YVI8_BDEBC|nr:HIT domain-containing protein [Bdellovibrio bacteriovorus]AFY00710.1 hit family hydrolase [Bdellovibrio bacteriovorus str. Tiberius]
MAAAKKARKKTSAKKTPVKRKAPIKAPVVAHGKIQIGKDVWPMERDVLFRPDRMKYVRKLIKPDGCVFCRASEEKVSFDTLCVFKSKHSMVVLNKFPYNSGHLLVLPKRHCGDLLKLSDEEYHDLQNVIRLTMKALNDLYQPGGINVGLNHGAVAGAGIPEHLHYHVIPRWTGDLNFFPLIAETKVLVESLEQTYEKVWSILRKYE